VDYSIIIAALITSGLTGAASVIAARYGKKVAVNTGTAVQTAEQRVLEDAKDEADKKLAEYSVIAAQKVAAAEAHAEEVKEEARRDAAELVASARAMAEETDQQREGWHAFQLTSLKMERDAVRARNLALESEVEAARDEAALLRATVAALRREHPE
jgi:hypothetical protein